MSAAVAKEFQAIRSAAVPLQARNVDTDQIIPARFLSRPRNEGYGDVLFRDLRFDKAGAELPDFILNDARYDGALILLARENFGSGSSRESAVYALLDFGFRAVIAPSFGDIFHSNAMKNGLLPVVLPADEVERIMTRSMERPDAQITIDLDGQQIEAGDARSWFDIDPFRKTLLLTGDDELGYTLALAGAVTAFEAQHQAERPWLA